MNVTPLRVVDDRATNALRQLPCSFEAERGLLGAILRGGRKHEAFDAVAEFLRPEHFAEPVNGRLYAAMAILIRKNLKVDLVTVRDRMANDDGFAALGGTQYLANLDIGAVTIINAPEYGRIIYDTWRRRELIALGEELVNRAFDPGPDETSAVIQESHEASLNALGSESNGAANLKSLGEVLNEVVSLWDQRSREGLVGLSYGMPTLDYRAGLMQGGQMITIGARPSMGKTALARVIAFHNARAFLEEAKAAGTHPKHVLFFSSEMSRQQQGGAILTAETGIQPPRRQGALETYDVAKLMEKAQELGELPLLVEDTAGLTLSHMRQIARRVQRMKGGLGLIIVDYLQLMNIERGVKAEGPVQVVSYLSKGFKEACRTLDVPGIALSQLNRAVEQRDNKRPQLSDLRESGAIEQDSDIIMFLYRDEYYLEREEPKRRDNEGAEQFSLRKLGHAEKLEAARGKAEVIVAKARLGAIGTAHLLFDGPRMWFSDPAPERRKDGPPPGHPAAEQMPMEGL
jgi:replicative DNA helicase